MSGRTIVISVPIAELRMVVGMLAAGRVAEALDILRRYLHADRRLE